MNPQVIVKRLAAAEGYLQLRLPQYALEELGRIPDAGVFLPIAELFAGEALQAQSRYSEAITALERAAHQLPPVLGPRALRALSQCYSQTGQETLAMAAAERAAASPGGVLTIVVSLGNGMAPVNGRVSATGPVVPPLPECN